MFLCILLCKTRLGRKPIFLWRFLFRFYNGRFQANGTVLSAGLLEYHIWLYRINVDNKAIEIFTEMGVGMDAITSTIQIHCLR